MYQFQTVSNLYRWSIIRNLGKTRLGCNMLICNNEVASDTYELYQLKVSQLRPSSWYSLSALPFLYSLEPSSFFQSATGGRSWTRLIVSVNLHISHVITTMTWTLMSF